MREPAAEGQVMSCNEGGAHGWCHVTSACGVRATRWVNCCRSECGVRQSVPTAEMIGFSEVVLDVWVLPECCQVKNSHKPSNACVRNAITSGASKEEMRA